MIDHSKNIIQEGNLPLKSSEPCILVIFGATGDLTARKLMPAIYNLAKEKMLPSQFACVGFARREQSQDVFKEQMHQGVAQFSRTQPIDETLWKNFSQNLFYHPSNFDDDAGYQALDKFLKDLDKKLGTKGNRVYYLSTQPSFFSTIIKKLHQNGLLYSEEKPWSRVIIEKPFGRDLQSAIALKKEISQYLSEDQTYRIDHYLGKETVQNLLCFRFSNPIFESLWNYKHIENVQITVGEEIGIGSRGRLFEESGIMRDIVQNHMMQLLSITAMEPPVSLNADTIRDEKVKVLESIRAVDMKAFDHYVVRAQYIEGSVGGQKVKGYRSEGNVDPKSNIETFVALKLFIDNWRWAGVPFYLRAGKRLPKRMTEIAVTFRNVPSFIMNQTGHEVENNVLRIRIQPDEGLSLKINCKKPGMSNLELDPVQMDFKYGSFFGSTPPEAYERLICDCMCGDSTLFARSDEVLASWRYITPILERWHNKNTLDSSEFYAAGTWGPLKADELLKRDNTEWK